MTSRADLHVHSKHSNQPTEWILRRLKAPESFTEPLEIYRLCRERGMDFVTITDHDSIDGALEIAHLPGTFLSEEITAEFPEDRCEVHVLVYGITEAQHREVQRLRRNLYELRDYIRAEGILASVAHPLFRVCGRLSLDQLEKLIVLFDRFETLNGMHDRRLNGLARTILSSLSPELIDLLADRHGLEPWGPRSWVKPFTGGSDDHCGVYVGTTWTGTLPAASVEEFLGHLRTGRCDAGGATGSTARLAHSLNTLALEYLRRQAPARIAGWVHPRLLDRASHWVSTHAMDKGSDLLDQASQRFLGRMTTGSTRAWPAWPPLIADDDPLGRRIVA